VKVLTATYVSRHFSAVLDEVDGGETIVVTRDGQQLAILTPVPAANGDAVTAALDELPDDDAYWDAVEAARAEVSRSWHVA
jgi:antitoxin (DNA-binding transcriptional repressor) of toxin-antitoxin stability system